ncbi:UNKNOWN [Stylonychia lemnae]|uniref:Uncharacterized protein n=1 Tax=Stylonychia lemnae TaxID=5949 RepID=A0A078ANA7_STYLE|nr:UNKNOWN [Stylonychia lemnae]|eukprot:CDW82827.1 UNKNOWN [Stylonychia lemnae]
MVDKTPQSILSGLMSYSQQNKPQNEEDTKFNIIPIDCMISNKTNLIAVLNQQPSQKPCKSYIEIQFNKEQEIPFFQYIVLQNFYTYSVTVKQFKGGVGDVKEQKKNEGNWTTILKDYQLMRNSHFETDAQNWHIIGTELFNTKFDRRGIKFLRIYLKQPSSSWLDYTLRNITMYMKKNEVKYQSQAHSQQLGIQRELTPFEMLKQNIRNNLKGLKKDDDKDSDSGSNQISAQGPYKRGDLNIATILQSVQFDHYSLF